MKDIIKLNELYKKGNKLSGDFTGAKDSKVKCFEAFCTENCGRSTCSMLKILQGEEFIQK